VGVNEDGTQQFETQLIGFKPEWEYQAKFDPMAFGSSRLHFADSKYASYYAHQQQFSENPDSAEVHQGDMLVFLDTDGNKLTGGWNWGTSHSLDERIDHDGEAFVTVSLGDAYPKGITFQRVDKISKKTIMQLDANMGGWANGDLGGLVILDEGYVWVDLLFWMKGMLLHSVLPRGGIPPMPVSCALMLTVMCSGPYG
jgi:hypothetical protein